MDEHGRCLMCGAIGCSSGCDGTTGYSPSRVDHEEHYADGSIVAVYSDGSEEVLQYPRHGKREP